MIDKLMTYFKVASYVGLKKSVLFMAIIILLICYKTYYPWIHNLQESIYNSQSIYKITADGKLLNNKLSKTLAPTGMWRVKPLNFILKVNQITHQKNFQPMIIFNISINNNSIQNIKAQQGYTLSVQNKNNLYILRIEKIQYQPSLVTFSLSRLD
jgi:hypothetical protein